MFKIIEGNFKKGQYSDEEYLDNWPMLYILENGKHWGVNPCKNSNDTTCNS